jgi:glutamate racemase
MIGVFDSGIGGLTVVKAIMAALPEYDMLYFGDTARTPYGSKSPHTVMAYSKKNVEFLVQRGAKIIVIACNTASSVASTSLTASFDLPIFEVITPGAQLAVAASKFGRIGVIGTRATIASGIYEQRIKALNPNVRVFSAACPLLVPLVEEGWLKRPETRMILKKYLHPLKVRQIDTLILGCTHYPVLKSLIQTKIGKRVAIIDSSVSVACQVKTFFEDHPDIKAQMSKHRECRFYVSDTAQQFERTAQLVLGRRVDIQQVDV